MITDVYVALETQVLKRKLDPATFVAFRLGAYDEQVADLQRSVRRTLRNATFGLMYGTQGPFPTPKEGRGGE